MKPEKLILESLNLPIEIRKNARAKRMTLRLNKQGDGICITTPKRCSEKAVMNFAQSQSEWIRNQLDKTPAKQPFYSGIKLEVFGDKLQFIHKSEQIMTDDDVEVITIKGDLSFFARRVEDWIRKRARLIFSDIARDYGDEVGVSINGVTIRDTSSRWGSCSRAGKLNFSWRLSLAPISVMRYVIAHEVAHRIHFDHSPNFWQLVEEIHPTQKSDRKWLKENGKKLHVYGK